MQKYPTYKPSNIDWIGEIPSNWSVSKLRFVTNEVQTGTTPPTDNEEYFESGDFNWFTPADFSSESVKLNDSKRKITELAVKDGKVKVFPKSSVLMVGIGATLGKIGIVNYPCSSNQQINAIVFNEKIKPYFGALFLFTNSVNIVSLANFATLPILNQSQTKDIPIVIPSLSEQQAIVTYLDEKTTLIDELIAKKERKIELLKEQRAALINQAVTKGLDENVSMKDSGLVDIGLIPSHWQMKKIKYVGILKSGDSITSEEIDYESSYPVYGGNGFRGFCDKYNYEGHYVLIGRQGALCGNINYAKGKFWASEHAVVITMIKEDETIWLGELLRKMNLNQYSQSAAQPGLAVDKIKNLSIPVPPLSEQQAIVAYLDEQTALIDKNIELESQKISTLKEYRQSLISNVVTGKICVA
ncbi:hypothetical protein GCM10011514_35780 [Emticicia aquatilis]|uniref:Type I restriction modification DNA specificity domain-containing protein n=1 Tax=Emticicia aquatilis TaxID=1537369 RepID=A0A917DT39_9BACT|nr:restriction endonuclease subunit S [Emticicia aquatilis]GGD68514.1 hypothetical protein GCM10011514_35780 [Emticicia aquatilis]